MYIYIIGKKKLRKYCLKTLSTVTVLLVEETRWYWKYIPTSCKSL